MGAAALTLLLTTLATLPGARAVAADADGIYVAARDAVWRVPPEGGLPVKLVAMTADALAVDGTHLYLSTGAGGRIARVPRRGGAADILESTSDTISGLAVDATHLYWLTSKEAGQLVARPKVGGPRRVLAEGQHYPTHLAAGGGKLVWHSQGRLLALPAAGGAPTEVAEIAEPIGALALQDDRLLVGTLGGLDLVDGSPGRRPGLLRAFAGGRTQILLRADQGPRALAVRGDTIFYIAGGQLHALTAPR